MNQRSNRENKRSFSHGQITYVVSVNPPTYALPYTCIEIYLHSLIIRIDAHFSAKSMAVFFFAETIGCQNGSYIAIYNTFNT